jgi:hypothetical protein
VDIEMTGNETGGDDSQNKNKNGSEDDNQPFITDDDEHPGMMETEEVNPIGPPRNPKST